MVSFGLQTNFAGLVVARCFAGVMNGNIVILKSVLAEITDETNAARAFGLLPVCTAIGMIVGPMIGGFLAQPAQQYPETFGNIGFFVKYPYFLPCFISGMTSVLAFILGFFFLEETLESKQKRSSMQPKHDLDEVPEELEYNKNAQRRPAFSALFTPTVTSVLLGSTLVFFQMASWTTVTPVFAYTRFEDGGLGLSMKQIGTALTANGFATIMAQAVIFPHMQKRWGTMRMFRTALLIWPMVFALLPIVRSLMEHQRNSYGINVGSQTALIGLMCVLAIQSFAGMSMVCVSLLINASAPSPAMFGALNGLGQMCSAFAKSVAPTITGAIFSISIEKHYLGGNLIWFCAILVSLLTFWLANIMSPNADTIRKRPI